MSKLTEEQSEALWSCYSYLLSLPVNGEAEGDRKTAGEDVTEADGRDEVYQKGNDPNAAEMTDQEKRDREEAKKHQKERDDNWFWNVDNHRPLMRRLHRLRGKLTEDEWQEIDDMSHSCRWGDAEVAQVKELIETAEWFSKLEP